MTISPEFPPSFPPHTEPFGPGQKLPPAVPRDLLTSAAASNLEAASVSLTTQAGIPLVEFYGKVSLAQLLQKVEELITALTDPAKTTELWRYTASEAERLKALLQAAARYDLLQTQLANLGLDSRRNGVNTAVTARNLAVQLDASDQQAIANLNAEISNFNLAQDNYEIALQAYQSALENFAFEQDAYDLALTNWEAALAAYQAGGSESDLNNARVIFEQEQTDYNSALDAFNTGPKQAFDDATTTYNSAKTALTSAQNAYNLYVSTRTPLQAEEDLNDAITFWNEGVAQAIPIINEMNDLREAFDLPPLELPVAVDPAEANFPLYTIPAEDLDNTIRNSAQERVDTYNSNVSALNTLIDNINLLITNITNGPTPPANPLVPVPQENIIPNLSFLLPELDAFSSDIDLTVVYTTPPPIDVTVLVAPEVAAFDGVENFEILIRRIVEDTEAAATAPRDKQLIIGGAGASISMSVINPGSEGLSSPFLERQLSRQAIESFFNQYGVPEASALVDQIGALYTRIVSLAGLVSAGPGQKILANAAIIGPSGAAAFNAGTALAFLRQLHSMASSPELTESIADLVNNNPDLVNLTPEEKSDLIEGLASEIGASLLKDGLAQVASDLGMPGLLPQLLAQLAGVTGEDALASFQQQLFRQVLLSQELEKAGLRIPKPEIDEILQTAFEQRRSETIQFIIDQIAKLSETNADIARAVIRASQETDAIIERERVRVEAVRRSAFNDTLIDALQKIDIEATQAASIASQIPVSFPITSEEFIRNELVRRGISDSEASLTARLVYQQYQLNDGFYNPLGAFLVQHLGTNTELSAFFKLQTINILTPTIGAKRAQEVAEDYGSLIFTSSDSILGKLQENERRVRQLDNYRADARLFEDYRDSVESYLNPTIAKESPLRLGKTLLLMGLGGGASLQGIVSGDDTLGPLANRTKHATNYPGILG